eukprot:1161945-Pelagomonas_calceolata.AAC.9
MAGTWLEQACTLDKPRKRICASMRTTTQVVKNNHVGSAHAPCEQEHGIVCTLDVEVQLQGAYEALAYDATRLMRIWGHTPVDTHHGATPIPCIPIIC